MAFTLKQYVHHEIISDSKYPRSKQAQTTLLLQKPHSVSYQQHASTVSLTLAKGKPTPPRFAQAATNTTGHSCDGEISILNHCLSWSKFVNTHLYHWQWFNIPVFHTHFQLCLLCRYKWPILRQTERDMASHTWTINGAYNKRRSLYLA